jgi:molybdopterin molybdotransferase
MKGFAERADVEEVLHFLAARVRTLGSEPVPLGACAGRVLAEGVVACVDVPAFARAAMDGYAVRGEDTFSASAYEPVELEVVGEALPGRPAAARVAAGRAVRVMTGAPLPEGADAVVMAEVCSEREGRVAVADAVAPGKHVGQVGEDIRAGDAALAAGRRLRPQDAGLLASLGVSTPVCVRRPRVRFVVTGDELLPAGSRPEPPRIVDSNSVVLRALVERDGGVASSRSFRTAEPRARCSSRLLILVRRSRSAGPPGSWPLTAGVHARGPAVSGADRRACLPAAREPGELPVRI